MNQKVSKGGRKPLWLSREFLKNLNRRKKFMECGKKGQATWEYDRSIVTECRDVTRKAKTHFKLSL